MNHSRAAGLEAEEPGNRHLERAQRTPAQEQRAIGTGGVEVREKGLMAQGGFGR